MSTGEDWLYRPAVRGMCKMESLLDGTLSLADVADANEALDVVDENEYRLQEGMRE
jgi:hypothetical protein